MWGALRAELPPTAPCVRWKSGDSGRTWTIGKSTFLPGTRTHATTGAGRASRPRRRPSPLVLGGVLLRGGGLVRLVRVVCQTLAPAPRGVWPPLRIFSYHAETIGDGHVGTATREVDKPGDGSYALS